MNALAQCPSSLHCFWFVGSESFPDCCHYKMFNFRHKGLMYGYNSSIYLCSIHKNYLKSQLKNFSAEDQTFWRFYFVVTHTVNSQAVFSNLSNRWWWRAGVTIEHRQMLKRSLRCVCRCRALPDLPFPSAAHTWQQVGPYLSPTELSH